MDRHACQSLPTTDARIRVASRGRRGLRLRFVRDIMVAVILGADRSRAGEGAPGSTARTQPYTTTGLTWPTTGAFVTNTIQFGVTTFGDVPHRPGEERLSDAAAIREIVDHAVLAESVGIDAFTVGEHHRDDMPVP